MASSYGEINSRLLGSAIANLLRAGISFLTALYLARELGPDDYGRFSYIVAVAMAVRQLIDVQASRAFYTFISAQTRSRKFIQFFLYWVIIQFTFAACISVFLVPEFFFEHIWAEATISLVILGLAAVFMQHQLWLVVASILESDRRNFLVNIASAVITASHAAVLIAFNYFDLLDLNFIFGALIFEWFIGAIVLYIAGMNRIKFSTEIDDSISNIFSEYFNYCAPLIPYAFVTFLYAFFDRWLLQYTSGFAEQAYYALALQFSAVAVIAMAPLIKILWKEYAEAYEHQRYDEVAALLTFYNRAACLVVSVIVAIVLPFSSELLEITLGENYLGALPALIVMLVFPCHQIVNQLLVAFLLAAKRTSLQTKVGYVFMVTSLPLCYLILAPQDWTVAGLQGGAVGLAVKIVVMQSLQLLLLVYVVNRYTPVSISKNFYFFSTPVVSIMISTSLFYLLDILDVTFYLSIFLVVSGTLSTVMVLCKYTPVFGIGLDELLQWRRG